MQPLILVKDAPEIQALYDEMKERAQDSDKRIEELKKMALHIAEQHQKAMKEIWQKVEEAARERGILPAEYSESTHQMSLDSGVLSISKKDEHTSNCQCLPCQLKRAIFS